MRKLSALFSALIFCAALSAAQQGRVEKPKATAVNAVLQPEEMPEGEKIKQDVLDALAALSPEDTSKAKTDFNRLTRAEKLAQTIVITVDIDSADKYRAAIEQGLVGGVLIQWGDYSLAQTKSLIDKLQSWARRSPSQIPLLIAIDYEGGTVYTPVTLGFPYLPTNMMLAAAGNEQDTITLFYIVASELRNVGVHINFAPVIDVNINPANPIIGVRSFGSDTKVVGDMGVALITGMQKAGVMAVAKHFPGHGETVIDSHHDLPRLAMSREDFETIHLPPFKQAVESGVMGVMTAHIVYSFIDDENPATFSSAILKDLLRKDLGFKGIVISDSLDMGGAVKGSTILDAAVKSLSSGVDMILTSRRDPALTHRQLARQIGKTIPVANIESAANKIFELKKTLGLFEERPPRGEDNGETSQGAFDYFAGKITREAVTVARAQEGMIPYAKNTGKNPKLCSVFFSPPRFADQLPAINAPFMEKGWQVDYYNASMRPKDADIKRAKKCMDGADLVLIGSLQWADKPIAAQRSAIRELLKTDKDVIFLSLMSPYDIKFYPEAKNIVALYGANKLSTRAAADIILGNIEPKGKLPVKI